MAKHGISKPANEYFQGQVIVRILALCIRNPLGCLRVFAGRNNDSAANLMI